MTNEEIIAWLIAHGRAYVNWHAHEEYSPDWFDYAEINGYLERLPSSERKEGRRWRDYRLTNFALEQLKEAV